MDRERFVERLIRVEAERIVLDPAFALRFPRENAALRASVERTGVIEPLWVYRRDDRWILIAGHARLAAARIVNRTSFQALELAGPASHQDLFMAAFVSNWNRWAFEPDRAMAVSQALKIGFTREQVIGELLPALGYPPQDRVLDRCLALFDMVPALIQAVVEERVPLRAVESLVRLSAADQLTFAAKMVPRIRLNANETGQVVEWLGEMMRPHGLTLAAWLESSPLAALLEDNEIDEAARSRRFWETVRDLRFPSLTAYEKNFERTSAELARRCPGLKLEPTQSFEEEGYWIRSRVKDERALERVIQALASERERLIGLLKNVL